MLHNVYLMFVSEDGGFDFKKIESEVDLDYFNIRHWRSLYSRLLEAQAKCPDKCVSLHISECHKEPFI